MEEGTEIAKAAGQEAAKETIEIAETTDALADQQTMVEEGEVHAQEEDNDATEEEEEEEDEEEEEHGMEVEAVENPAEEIDDEEKGIVEDNAEVSSEKAETEEDMAKHSEATYSTRGRSGETALDILAESIHCEAEAQLPLIREKEHPPTIGPSFLSDSLTEEERRTRTRYIPNVDGMHALRKQEIKGDLTLARCMTTSASVASTLAKKARRAREDDMDVDVDVAPSDDDKASEILRLGSRKIEIGGVDYRIPSAAFVAPSGMAVNGDSAAKSAQIPPTVVESVTAFNPPRPPESVGPKKKHRMLRWERRPVDIEVDLNTYRKTVQTTREELKKAMAERDRIEMMDSHLRRHFFNHLECMSEEFMHLTEETAKVQQECVSAADLLTSRTRSRGAGKSSYVMRDVLAVLRARGTELQEKSLPFNRVADASVVQPRGAGGIGEKSFQRRDVNLPISQQKACLGWITAGDKVVTAYGEGKVTRILPPYQLEYAQNPTVAPKEQAEETEMMDVDEPERQESASKDESPPTLAKRSGSKLSLPLPPRVEVRLQFGVGYFALAAVEPTEDPASFSDARMALRWRGLMETAQQFGEFLDIEAMDDYLPSTAAKNESQDAGGLPVPGQGETTTNARASLLPFGSDLIPTPVGRGAFVAHKSMEELDEDYTKVFFGGRYVHGRHDNPGVPSLFRESEEKQQELIVMKAKLRQLKNEVNRQRRIRQLNQRTYTAAQERAVRIESLVSEMRTDLQSLKRRLDEEVEALGIDDSEAEKILLSYYNKDGFGDGEDSSPFKRSRKNPEMDLETEDEDEVYHSNDGPTPVPTQEVSV